MSTRNTRSSNNAGTLTVNGAPYTLVRSDVFYYLKFIDFDKELFNSSSNITSKPTIVLYTEDAQDKIILDYSLANETDKTYLKSFFANMTQTDSFGMNNGGYLDKSELEANLGCTLTYSAYEDNKIFADVDSVLDQNEALDVYLSDYFTATPQLTKSGNLGTLPTTENYALISVNPNTNKPLASLGVIVGDLLEVVHLDSSNNQTKFEVTEIVMINEKEVFKLKPAFGSVLPVAESLVGSPSIVNVYTEGKTTKTLNLRGALGCCSNGVEFIEDNTDYQCSVRSGFNFTLGSCSPKKATIISSDIIQNTNLLPTIISQVVAQNPTTAQSTITSFVVTDLSFESKFNVFIETKTNKGIAFPSINLRTFINDSQNIDHKISIGEFGRGFYQTSLTNRDFLLRLSTHKTAFVPYTTNTFGFFTDDGISSYLIIKPHNSMPELYLFLEDISAIPRFGTRYHSSDYSVTL